MQTPAYPIMVKGPVPSERKKTADPFESTVFSRRLRPGTYGEAYDRAMFLDERRVMMQQYADYLSAAADGKVIAGNFGRKAA